MFHCNFQTLRIFRKKKYSAVRRVYNSLLGVWKCDETLSFVFDILVTTRCVCFCSVCPVLFVFSSISFILQSEWIEFQPMKELNLNFHLVKTK